MTDRPPPLTAWGHFADADFAACGTLRILIVCVCTAALRKIIDVASACAHNNLRPAKVNHRICVAASVVLATFVWCIDLQAAENLASRPSNDQKVPPVEIVMTVENGAAKCAPAELRLRANSDVAMNVVNKSTSQMTLTAPHIFENKNVFHHTGDLVHVASNDGYLVKANGKGVLKVRTIVEGSYPYGCASVTNQSKPFEGNLLLAPSNQ